MQDLRYAIRLLIKSPSYTAVALGTLALGIAANAAIFSVVNALLLKPLPYPGSERLVMLWQDLRARGGPPDEWLAPAHFFDWRSRTTTLENSTVYRGGNPNLTGAGEPEQLDGWLVSGDFFRVLGVAPMLGRDFAAGDDVPGAAPTTILTHGLWSRRFGADPSIVGRTIPLDREAHTVIGVLPADFRNPFGAPDLYRPLRLNPAEAPRTNITLRMIARLRADTSIEQAQAEMSAVGAALAAEYPDTDAGSTIRITRLHDEVTGDVRTPLFALLGAVVLVLLIACANIANLQLARASMRGREIAVRRALGASGTRIVRQLLTESVVLGALGGALGLLLGSWILAGLLGLAPENVRVDHVGMDGAVLAFAMALALGTSTFFGLVPALQSARRDVAAGIREGGRGAGAGHSGALARNALVVTELALALMLIAGAGLLMRSLLNLRDVDPGFDRSRVLVGDLALPALAYEQAAAASLFYTSLLERLDTTPGIQAAGVVSVLPFSGADTDTSFHVEGRPAPRSPGETPAAWYRIVSPGYLRALGMRMEAGRFIEQTDVDTTERVVVINRTLARRHWPGEDPIGRRILIGENAFTVIGVVGDVHHRNLREDPRGEIFLSYRQFPTRRMTLVLRTAGDPMVLVPALRQHVSALDPNLPLSSVTTMERLLSDSLALPRTIALLMGAFAGASLLLAGVGIYGLMAYAVALRTHEFGIRMALGAAARDVLVLVLGQAARLTAIGIAIGAIAALGAARLIGALLFGVTPADAPTFAGTAALLGGIALLASYLPARRAVRVDPVAALRDG